LRPPGEPIANSDTTVAFDPTRDSAKGADRAGEDEDENFSVILNIPEGGR